MEPNHDVVGEPEVKRRKIRKGTSSCWECKRRKVRCTFAAASDSVCISCQRRGTNCLSQEFPEEASSPEDRARHVGDRIGRVEALVDKLVKAVGGESDIGPSHGQSVASENRLSAPTIPPTPYSCETEPSRILALYEPSAEEANLECDHSDGSLFRHPEGCPASIQLDSRNLSKYVKLSETLHGALPSREDIEMIWRVGAHVSISFHRVMMVPYSEFERNGFDPPETLLDIPGPDTHPVLLAKYIFLVAIVLQYLDPKSYEQIKGLSESPRAMMQRLANTAISLVTTRNELLGTIEALECIMLEGIYQANCGNLRQAWITFRRAMTVGQLMGIHRMGSYPWKVLNPQTRFNAQLLWFRIVYTDRFLCLILGLPQGSLDRSMASAPALANETPMGRLERTHCAIASRLLERNDTDPGLYDFAMTQEIDRELQEAAKIMPNRWWLPPNLAAMAGHDEAVFWEMLRLMNQLYHYNLINQLHLPFILRFTADERRRDLSRMMCVNASREVLSRFITFRSFNLVAYCCRAVDFFALMAVLTLLIAHLDSHRQRNLQDRNNANDTNQSHIMSSDLNFLAHQRLGDRAMMEQALEKMDQLGHVSMDTLSTNSAGLVRRLLAIEEEAANGRSYSTHNVRIRETQPGDNDGANVLRIQLPYLGTISITSEGVIPERRRIDGHARESPTQSFQDYFPTGTSLRASAPAPSNITSDQRGLQPMPQYHALQPLEGETPADEAGPFGSQLPQAVDGSSQQPYLYPGLAASVDDWAFQGVDMVFFDNLMRGSMLYDGL